MLATKTRRSKKPSQRAAETAQELRPSLRTCPPLTPSWQAVPLRDEIGDRPIDDDHLIGAGRGGGASSGRASRPRRRKTTSRLARIISSSPNTRWKARPRPPCSAARRDAGRRGQSTGNMERLFEIVDSAWQTRSSVIPTAGRYITLPDAGDFLLAETGPQRPEPEHGLPPRYDGERHPAPGPAPEPVAGAGAKPSAPVEEPAAARTAPSRPTAWRRRTGASTRTCGSRTRRACCSVGRQEEAAMGFTCVWMPRDRPGLVGDFAEDLRSGCSDRRGARLAGGYGRVNADFIAVSLCVPQRRSPTGSPN